LNLRGLASALTLTAIAVVLALTTVILAPLPLMLLRRNGGRTSFLLGSVLASALLIWFATPMVLGTFLAAVVLTFVLCESENQNLGYTSSVFVTLLVLVGFAAIATGYAIGHYGFDPVVFFRNQITQAMGQVSLPTGVTLDKEALVKQVPSAVVILVIFSIWVNSVLVPKVEQILGWAPTFQEHTFLSSEFRSWKLPDSIVWIALLTAAGTFFDVEPEWAHWVAANIFNVMVMLYFFQGLAIVVDFFAVKRVSTIWRLVAYMFIFSQLFLMVSFLGFVDLWVGFRNRTKTDKSVA
jgi:predicted membrane protein DUF2232